MCSLFNVTVRNLLLVRVQQFLLPSHVYSEEIVLKSMFNSCTASDLVRLYFRSLLIMLPLLNYLSIAILQRSLAPNKNKPIKVYLRALCSLIKQNQIVCSRISTTNPKKIRGITYSRHCKTGKQAIHPFYCQETCRSAFQPVGGSSGTQLIELLVVGRV